MLLENETITAPNVDFGAYKIPDFMKPSIGTAEAILLNIPKETLNKYNQQIIAGISGSEAGRNYVSVKNNVVYIGASPISPSVGDVRITFTQKKAAEISLPW